MLGEATTHFQELHCPVWANYKQQLHQQQLKQQLEGKQQLHKQQLKQQLEGKR